MPFLYFVAATQMLRVFFIILKVVCGIFALWYLLKVIRRFAIQCFYAKITRIVICGKKDQIQKTGVPTGYSEGYYRTEHYKYVYRKNGAKYKAKVYFGRRFFIPYSFKETDRLFLRLLDDGDISLNSIQL